MKFLRLIAVVTLLDRRKSEDISTLLNVFKMVDKIEQ